jgi:hypothetical protein
MGKLHLHSKRYTQNSGHHVKLGNNPFNSLCQLQKARLELVEPDIKHAEKPKQGQSWLS